MSKSTPSRIVQQMAKLSVLGLAILLEAACAGPVAQAPFAVRPEYAAAGNLLGPYDGQVVDQSTGNPISGALVLGSWAIESTSGLNTPLATHTESVQTTSNGGYTLPRLSAAFQRSGLVRRFSLLVYKAGYVGYRSDFRTDAHLGAEGQRRDFTQQGNRIRLDRFPQGESHARHLVFLGSVPEVRRAAQTELVQAALELAERTPSVVVEAPKEAIKPKLAEPLTLAGKLLTRADVQALAGPKQSYLAAPLENVAAEAALSTTFDSIHYRAEGGDEQLDTALRVWQFGSGIEARAIFDKLKAQLAAPQLRDATGATAGLTVPTERAQPPLIAEVPEKAPPLRDAAGKPAPLPPIAANAGAASQKNPSLPLKVDAVIRAYDAKLRIHGVLVLSARLGLVLKLTCGANLCKDEDTAGQLMTRVLSRI